MADLAGARPKDSNNVLAQKVSLGTCPGGDVVGYRFADEGHVPTFKANLEPRANAYDMAWDFLKTKRK